MGPLLKCRDLRRFTGKGRSANYGDVKAGLLVPPIKTGSKAVAWPQPEVERVMAARAAGASDTDLRAIVADLVSERLARAKSLGLTIESAASVPRKKSVNGGGA